MLSSLLVLLFPFLLFIGSAGAEIAMTATAVLFLIHSALTKEWKWLREKWLLCLALLWGYMLLRGLFAENPHEALHRAAPFLRYGVFAAALAYWVMHQPDMRRYFLYSLTAAVGFIVFDGFIQWKIGYDLFGRDILPDSIGNVRLTGPFGQTKPIMGIVLAWLSFPICLHLLLTENGALQSGKKLLPGALFSFAVLAMVALSGERMALLLTLLGWFIALLLTRISKRIVFGILVGGAVLLAIMVAAIPSLRDRQVNATVATLQHWQESAYGKIMASDMKLAVKNPVFGLGANHFRIACPELYPGADKDTLAAVCNIHPHNIFMEWLIEEGIIGLGLFLAFIGFLFTRWRAAWPLMRTNPLYLGWGIAFALRIWPVGSTTGFFSNWGAPPFWLAIGMLLAYTGSAQPWRDDAGTAIPR